MKYLNELAKFVGPNKLELTDKKGKTREVTANKFVVAVGGKSVQKKGALALSPKMAT